MIYIEKNLSLALIHTLQDDFLQYKIYLLVLSIDNKTYSKSTIERMKYIEIKSHTHTPTHTHSLSFQHYKIWFPNTIQKMPCNTWDAPTWPCCISIALTNFFAIWCWSWNRPFSALCTFSVSSAIHVLLYGTEIICIVKKKCVIICITCYYIHKDNVLQLARIWVMTYITKTVTRYVLYYFHISRLFPYTYHIYTHLYLYSLLPFCVWISKSLSSLTHNKDSYATCVVLLSYISLVSFHIHNHLYIHIYIYTPSFQFLEWISKSLLSFIYVYRLKIKQKQNIYPWSMYIRTIERWLRLKKSANEVIFVNGASSVNDMAFNCLLLFTSFCVKWGGKGEQRIKLLTVLSLEWKT